MTTLLIALTSIVMVIALLAMLAGWARCEAAKRFADSDSGFAFGSESDSRFAACRVQSHDTLGE